MTEMTMLTPPAASFLTVGLSLKLSFMQEQRKVLYGAALLGWKEHAWLVCEWPAQLTSTMSKGTACTISYLHDGKLVGCRSEIRDLVRAPVPLLFLAFPQGVDEVHLRKHIRVTSCEPALLIRTDAGSRSTSPLALSDYTGGLLQDLSAGGCRIAVTKRPSWLRPGSTVRMEFELPGLGHVTNLTALVKNADVGEGAEILGVAFRYDQMEYIEYRGWGGSVQQAIAQWTLQRKPDTPV